MGVLLQLFQLKAYDHLGLTAAQQRMYTAEKLENFRWISKLVATCSNHELTEADHVADELTLWLREIGQFAEVAYTSLPLDSLLRKYDLLNQPGFPFEGYYALSPRPYPSFVLPLSDTYSQSRSVTSSGVRLLKALKGNVAGLPAAIFFRWIHESKPRLDSGGVGEEYLLGKENERCTRSLKRQQIIISICGTASFQQAFHDLRAFRKTHPGVTGHTASVHTGFWDLYQGMKLDLMEGIEEALRIDPSEGEPRSNEDAPDSSSTGSSEEVVRELVITGHSMGGAIAHLFCIDLLSPACPPKRASTQPPTPIPRSPGPSTRAPSPTPTTEHSLPNCPEESKLQQLGLKYLQVVTFGEPRTGNQALVDHWRAVKKRHEEEHGTLVHEWCIKGYNDGVPALPLIKFGYRHFAQQPLYTVNGKVYRIPEAESESTLFRVAPSSLSKTSDSPGPSSKAPLVDFQSPCEMTDTPTATVVDQPIVASPDPSISLYPLGGHNYYNARDLEGGFLRRLDWLAKSGFDKDGWEHRYRAIMEKRFT